MFLLFDIGGTKTRIAVSEKGKSFHEPYVFETPKNFDEAMKAFKKASDKLKIDSVNRAVGGIRGVLSKEKDILLNDYHLNNWIEKPLKRNLQDIFSTEVLLENDTALVGLGEAVRGAGKGFDIVAYITISTGVGGARIVNGKIDVSTYNSEPGHQIIDADGSICPDCGTEMDVSGGFEALVSGSAMEKRFGKKPKEIKEQKIWLEVSNLVAYGINNTVVHWAPEAVVLGGGMMKSPGIILASVEAKLKEILRIYPVKPKLKKAQLGDFGGLYGALNLLNS